MEEANNITAKKTDTRKVHLQLKISEAFDMCINSMNNMSLSTTNKYRFIKLIKKSSNTIKDAFVHIGGKLAELPNQIRDTVAREMIRIMSDDLPPSEELTPSCHHDTPLHHHCVTPLSPMDNPIIIPPLSSL